MSDAIRFTDDLDLDAAAAVFAAGRRVRIANVLEASSAERLHTCLAGDVPWKLVYNENATHVIVDEAVFRERGPHFQRELLQQILTRAQDEFQYLYRSFPLVPDYLEQHPGPISAFLHRVFDHLNRPDTLALLRTITGIGSLQRVSAQATLYQPGHFLKAHDDLGLSEERRRVAYVLYATRKWHTDWGGQLQFLSKNGGIEEAWVPTFNSLVLFAVPTWHAVTYVSPFAKHRRYAITGWLHDS